MSGYILLQARASQSEMQQWKEFLFRGVVMQSLDSAFGPRPILHRCAGLALRRNALPSRIPERMVGRRLASVYGIMLGLIHRRSGGLLAPWLAHVFADMVIFAILTRGHFKMILRIHPTIPLDRRSHILYSCIRNHSLPVFLSIKSKLFNNFCTATQSRVFVFLILS